MPLPISCRPPEFFIQLLLSSSDMDRDRQKDSKASSREAISPRQSYYECIFCKMGLSTAQALGGHMNIHRKDRTKRQQTPPVPPTVADEKSDEDPGSRRCFHPYAKRMASMEEDVGLGRPPKLDFSGEGLELSLSMHVYDLVDGLEEKEEVVVEEGELDLELRLGH